MQSGSDTASNSPSVPAWPVMVLAHNEERHITNCLDSIVNAEQGRAFEVFVMANGCTDRTEDIVKQYARRCPQVHCVSIDLGDKCNAWNVFIHDTVPAHAPDSEVYFFMDGDCRAAPGSFSSMANALATDLRAYAASAVPASGRNIDANQKEMLRERGLAAGFYALRGSFVSRLRTLNVRLPLKLEGNDGLIGALARWDLDPQRNQYDDSRILPCADAGFLFESMSPTRLSDWLMYWKRAVRYGRRHYEFKLLAPSLKAKGIAGLPRDITELYGAASSLPLRWQGLYTLPNWVALSRMRRIGAAGNSLSPRVRRSG